jgi:light-regulated signal transduction histidine kinase (bacteriophytochrome)
MLSQIESQNAEIMSFNQQLEQKVEVRTSELESANRELESFSYSVSHDLRAPLRKINSFINIFIERFKVPIDAENRLLLDRIVANSNKMGKLIDDLLAFARIGKIELEKKPISMTQIVKNLSDDVGKQESGRNIQFSLHALPQITADPTAITQVWENLISNAVKYTANREVATIEIDSQVTRDEVVYFIKDNGSGFDMKHYEKLFTAFERLHSNSEFEGTGVGLAIVQRILDKHGGRIWAESEKDKGTTFFFSLPKNENPVISEADTLSTLQA